MTAEDLVDILKTLGESESLDCEVQFASGYSVTHVELSYIFSDELDGVKIHKPKIILRGDKNAT